MNPLRNAVNRVLLALGGLVLLAGGGWLVTTSSSLTERLPSGWPTAAPSSVLLDQQQFNALRAHDWWTAAVIVGTAGVLLL